MAKFVWRQEQRLAQEEPLEMVTEPPEGPEQKSPRIRRGRVDSVDLYEIKDGELDVLERGSQSGLQLNFSIFLLSIAFSAICALSTTSFPNSTTRIVFIVVAVVGVLLGLYLFLAWFRTRKSLRDLCQTIRNRIPPDLPPPNLVQATDGPLEDNEQPSE